MEKEEAVRIARKNLEEGERWHKKVLRFGVSGNPTKHRAHYNKVHG